MAEPIRVLTAVPICDGHDSAINTINLELVHGGVEVIYLGYHRSAQDIVRAALQEGARAIGISSYNGGHVEFFAEVTARLKAHGAGAAGGRGRHGRIGLFGGGGGTITKADAREMLRRGVDRIFFAGTPLREIVEFVREKYGASPPRALAPPPVAPAGGRKGRTGPTQTPLVVGITGPGGAGKTTLIDELVLRFLRARPDIRIGILSHDPSIVKKGALLGDRAAMIYSQDDRVFMRSLASRGAVGGLSRESTRWLRGFREQGDFDFVFVETVGIGQEAVPFRRALVDLTVHVMSPEYGSRLQLQKIAMLDVADLIVVNKSDLASARTAAAEIEGRLRRENGGHRQPQVFTTIAKQHRDAGVDRLFCEIASRAQRGATGTPLPTS